MFPKSKFLKHLNYCLYVLRMWREEEMIKVVTGVRRCGKSTLFDNLEDVSYSELLD